MGARANGDAYRPSAGHRLRERLTIIKTRLHTLRGLLRRRRADDMAAIEAQLDGIDREVDQAEAVVEELEPRTE